MKLLLIGLIGLIVGIFRAKKRGGSTGDMVTWGIGHALGFIVLVLIILGLFDFIWFYVL